LGIKAPFIRHELYSTEVRLPGETPPREPGGVGCDTRCEDDDVTAAEVPPAGLEPCKKVKKITTPSRFY
jgi:hypothetical protein